MRNGRVPKTNNCYGILAQLGEHLPYKQRVIGSSPIGPIKYGEIAQLARAHGSYPWCRGFESPSRYLYGILAQLGEHLPYKQRVIGSSPIGPIKYGEIAQLARAHGSYPWCRGFESPSRYLTKGLKIQCYWVFGLFLL